MDNFENQVEAREGTANFHCASDEASTNNHIGYMMNGRCGGWTGTPIINSGISYLWLINSLLITVLLATLIRYFWKKTK